MTRRWNRGEFPSLFCASDDHEECIARRLRFCTCRCHYWLENGLELVIESERCVPDCRYCNGTNDAPCFCGPGCLGPTV